jgi:crotonobetainyl-CoA:carnitine CoA-transferase CaiB-like acyl-CoA transferase
MDRAAADQNYEGLKVLDFSRVLAGPYLTMLMADNGAEVIKIERPFVGAEERDLAPIAEGKNGRQSGYFMMLNRGKKSVVMDLKDPDAKEALYRLIRWADVIIENFSPGVMGRLGIGYETVKKMNPSVVYCSISMFGQKGPLADRPGYDITAQAMSGLMWLTGEPDGKPMRSGTSIGDVNAAAHAFGAIGAALYYRGRTGKGQHIDIALRDCLSAVLETGVIRHTISHGSDNPMRSGVYHATMMPYGVFDAGNGRYVAMSALMDHHWKALCRLMDAEEWGAQKKFGDSRLRAVNQKEVIETIEKWLQGFDDCNAPLARLASARVPAAPVCSVPDVLADEQYRMRNNIVEVNDPVFGPIELPASPMVFSETTVDNPVPPPLLGQDTTAVLRDIAGLSAAAIESLMERVGLVYEEPGICPSYPS